MQFHGGGAKVMVVASDRTILEMLQIRLDVAGYHPIGMRSGVQAIDILRHTRPDALLIDLDLQDIDGLEVVKALNTQPDRVATPTLLMGRQVSTDTIRRGIDYGVRDCLAKPFSGADVIDRVARLLKGPRSLTRPTHYC